MTRVVAGSAGLLRGRESCTFSGEELRAAAASSVLDVSSDRLELDMEAGAGGGRLVVRCAGAGGGAVAPAAAPLALPLAPDVHRRDVELCWAGGAGAGSAGRLRLRTLRDVPPAAPLEMWFDEQLLAAVDMPFLTPRNIKGRKSYECHNCGVQFERPNPLKLHLFLACEPYSASKFWRRVLRRLAPPASPASPAPLNLSVVVERPRSHGASAAAAAVELAARCLSEPPFSAFRPYRHAWLGGFVVGPPQPPVAWRRAAEAAARAATAAEAEAFATDWGKSKEGHLCLYCGKVYSRKYGLKIHIRTHTGYKPLQCKYCLRPFGDPSNLNKHVRLHAQAHAQAHGDVGDTAPGAPSAALPYACPLPRCGKLLVRRRDLDRHLRSRHPSAPHAPHTPHAPHSLHTPHAPRSPRSPHTPRSPRSPHAPCAILSKDKTLVPCLPSP